MFLFILLISIKVALKLRNNNLKYIFIATLHNTD